METPALNATFTGHPSGIEAVDALSCVARA